MLPRSGPTPSPPLVSPAWTPASKKSKPANTTQPQQEAPYLTHIVRHHGRITLTAPDNHGAMRKASAAPTPMMASSSSSLSLPLSNDDGGESGDGESGVAEPKVLKKKVKRKVKKPKQVDPAILDAVANVGRGETPPLAAGATASGSPEELRLVPPSTEDQRRQRSRERRRVPSPRANATAMSEGSYFPANAQHSHADAQDSHAELLPPVPTTPPPAYPPGSPAPSPSPSPSPTFHTPPAFPSLPLPEVLPLGSVDNVEDDPLVLAWEQDRAAGLPLDVRIARDLERRGVSPATDESDPRPVPSRRLSMAQVAAASADKEERGEIENAERGGDLPRVARALSIYAGRKFAEAAERRRERERTETQAGLEQVEEGVEGDANVSDELAPPMVSSPVPIQEEEEEEQSEEEDDAPSRPIDRSAGQRFAEAAERRIAAIARARRQLEGPTPENNLEASTPSPPPSPPVSPPSPPPLPLPARSNEPVVSPPEPVLSPVDLPPVPPSSPSRLVAHAAPIPPPSRPPPPPPPPSRNFLSATGPSQPPPLAPRPHERLQLPSPNPTSSILSRVPSREEFALMEPLQPDRPPVASTSTLPASPPTSTRRRPPPPPPTRAPPPIPQLVPPPIASASVPSLALPPSSSMEFPRPPRPLPVPPESSDRVDALTALRREGILPDAVASPCPPLGPQPPSTLPPRLPSPSWDAQPSASLGSDRPGADEYVYTDLDVLLARLERSSASNYEDLLLVGEMLGQAVDPGSTPSEIESLPYAPVMLERRRIDKQGRVKQKLSVVGVRCVDCQICLARFKVGEMAVALPKCLHVFHARCVQSWLRKSQACPLCRQAVFDPRPNIEL